MKENEISVKGIILSVYPQGEYGRRVSLLSDRFGRITVFAQGAAKQTSRIIGACRPFVCGEFTLAQGKNAWGLHGVSVIESFGEIPLYPDTAFLGSYFLELADYFSAEGMTEEDTKKRLNLLYVALRSLKEKSMGITRIPAELQRRIYELRMLVQEGTYTELPENGGTGAAGIWRYVIASPLSGLFRRELWPENGTAGTDEQLSPAEEEFCEAVDRLRKRMIGFRFRSEELL